MREVQALHFRNDHVRPILKPVPVAFPAHRDSDTMLDCFPCIELVNGVSRQGTVTETWVVWTAPSGKTHRYFIVLTPLPSTAPQTNKALQRVRGTFRARVEVVVMKGSGENRVASIRGAESRILAIEAVQRSVDGIGTLHYRDSCHYWYRFLTKLEQVGTPSAMPVCIS